MQAWKSIVIQWSYVLLVMHYSVLVMLNGRLCDFLLAFICTKYHWYMSVLYKRFLTLYTMAFGTVAKWVWAIGRSFPHDPETVGDREPWCIQLSLYNYFRYLKYPKRFILATRLCSHCHRSRSFVVLPKTRQILGMGAFQADSRQIPGTGDLRCLAHHKQFMITNRVR